MMRPDCAALLVTAGHPDHDNCSEVVFMKVRSRETALLLGRTHHPRTRLTIAVLMLGLCTFH